jgi:transposase-like protein
MLMGLESFVEQIASIQTSIDGFCDLEKGEVLEIDAKGKRLKRKAVYEYLGAEIPPTMLCVNDRRRIAVCKPVCPECGSLNIRENGWMVRKPIIVTGKKVELVVQKYMCNKCKHPFVTPLDELVEPYLHFSKDIISLAVHLYINCHQSFESSAETIEELTGIEIDKRSVKRWVKRKRPPSIESGRKETGVYHVDEQRISLNGEVKWRHAILSSEGKVIADSVQDDKKQETITKNLIEHLGNEDVHVIVTDIDNKYPGAIEELRRHIAERKGVPLDQVKIKHQLCVFHLFQLITMELKKSAGFNPFARKRLPPDLDRLKKDLFAVFYHRARKGAREALDKIVERRWEYKDRARSLIERIDQHFEDLTWFMVDPTIPKTNNIMENYFSTTVPNKVKHRYKTKETIDAALNGLAMRRSWGKSWMGLVGLSVSTLEILGKLALIGV